MLGHSINASLPCPCSSCTVYEMLSDLTDCHRATCCRRFLQADSCDRARRTSATVVVTTLFMCGLIVGCNRPDYELAPVSGVVTLDGQPLAEALVITQPIAKAGSINPGPGSFGKTNEQGQFSLELVYPATPGAIVGEHRVRINKVTTVYQRGREDAPVSVRNPLPRSATDGSIDLNVPPEGTDQVQFDLRSK